MKTVMTLTWYRHFERNGGLNQILKWNMSHPTHQGTGMSKYSGFILVIRNTVVQSIVVVCHRMLENSGVGMHKFHYICIMKPCVNFAFDANEQPAIKRKCQNIQLP